ncbi:MAG: ABC transporter permease [Chloroflexota bacterium]
MLYSFNDSRTQSWPIEGFTLHWWDLALGNQAAREALILSLEAGIGATLVALVLGSLAAFAVHRFRFFGRETISFALLLPIALPGIVTGIALSASIDALNLRFGLLTIIGHATFCVGAIIYNNAIAGCAGPRPPRGGIHGWRGCDPDVPARDAARALGTAIIAGGLLAFALSFDEIIVTNFTAGTEQTLPIWT